MIILDNQKFIITDNELVRKKLLNLGYVEVQSADNHFVFLNNSKINFSENNIDVRQLRFSNIMCI